MFEIWIDKDGYYTTEYIENITNTVEVLEMPTSLDDIDDLKAYRYNPEIQNLELVEDKLKELQEERASRAALVSDSVAEKIKLLEQQLKELKNSI